MHEKHVENITDLIPPKLLLLMKHYNITKNSVAKQLGKDPVMVSRALDPKRFGTVTHQHIYPIRTRITHLLTAAGWEGDAFELWNEYDKKLAA